MSARVTYDDPDPSGLAAIVGGLIEENLARDRDRERLLQPALISIEASDAGVAVTLRIDRDGVRVRSGADPNAQLRITAGSAELLEVTAAPLRFGLPDPLRREGREILRSMVARRLRIAGSLAHPRRLARLTMLLSAR